MSATTYKHPNATSTATTTVHEIRETRSASLTSTSNAWSGAPTRTAVWTGRCMSGLVVVFLLLASALPKIFLPEIALASMRELEIPEHHLSLLACIEVVGALLYALPRTAALGAVVLTGLLGGAIAVHLRQDAPLFTHTLFPAYLGVFMWGGLWLRDTRVRQLLPLS